MKHIKTLTNKTLQNTVKKENERNRYCSFIGKYTRKGLETVSFFTFLEEKITEILFQLFFLGRTD